MESVDIAVEEAGWRHGVHVASFSFFVLVLVLVLSVQRE